MIGSVRNPREAVKNTLFPAILSSFQFVNGSPAIDAAVVGCAIQVAGTIGNHPSLGILATLPARKLVHVFFACHGKPYGEEYNDQHGRASKGVRSHHFSPGNTSNTVP